MITKELSGAGEHLKDLIGAGIHAYDVSHGKKWGKVKEGGPVGGRDLYEDQGL